MTEKLHEACIVQLCKDKRGKRDFEYHKGTSLLSIPGNLYQRVMILRIVPKSEFQVDDERDFRSGTGRADQMLGFKKLLSLHGKGRNSYIAFIDSKKANDKTDRLLQQGIASLWRERIFTKWYFFFTYIKVSKQEGECFSIEVGLR